MVYEAVAVEVKLQWQQLTHSLTHSPECARASRAAQSTPWCLTYSLNSHSLSQSQSQSQLPTKSLQQSAPQLKINYNLVLTWLNSTQQIKWLRKWEKFEPCTCCNQASSDTHFQAPVQGQIMVFPLPHSGTLAAQYIYFYWSADPSPFPSKWLLPTTLTAEKRK